jgi:hypothetical protein
MPLSSLREIERTMTLLWMNREARHDFLAGHNKEIPAPIANEIDRRGVELYAQLLKFGHHDVMQSIYPLCAKLLGKSWESIVDDYLEANPPDHFNLNRSAKRFPQYVESALSNYTKRFPYLAELADYEWIEMEMLEINKDLPQSDLEKLETPEQFTIYSPVVNPAMITRHYQYPIIAIAERIEASKHKPVKVKPGASDVVVYRSPQTNGCRFLSVGPVAAKIIEAARDKKSTYADLISLAVSMNPNDNPTQVVADFLELVEYLQTNHLFLGSTKSA